MVEIDTGPYILGEPDDRGHGWTDRRPGLRAIWADERGDRDCGRRNELMNMRGWRP
jgi:hypothetical protein